MVPREMCYNPKLVKRFVVPDDGKRSGRKIFGDQAELVAGSATLYPATATLQAASLGTDFPRGGWWSVRLSGKSLASWSVICP